MVKKRSSPNRYTRRFWIWSILLGTLGKVVLRVKQLQARAEIARSALAVFPPSFSEIEEAENIPRATAKMEAEKVDNMLSGAQRDEKESFGTVFKVGKRLLRLQGGAGSGRPAGT